MKKYKVPFSGFCYVEADSPEEARELAEDDDAVYSQQDWGDPEEVEDFYVSYMDW